MTDNTFNGFIPPKKNYFHMPNEWIDICAGIKSLAELKVVQYVLRHTWGFQEYDGTPKTITTDEFMHGRWYADGKKRMDKGTGLSNRSVIDGLNNAEEHGYLICDIDDSDKARIVKSYALKMVAAESDVKHLHSGVNILHTENRCEEPSQQVCTSFTSTVNILHSDCEEPSHRSEKDTKERNFRKTRKEKHESIPAHESDTTFSPPGVGDARAFSSSSKNETHSQQGDRDVLDTSSRLPAVGIGGTGVGRGSDDLGLEKGEEIDNTFSEKENLPTSTPAQPLPPGTEQAALGTKGKGKKQDAPKVDVPKGPPVMPGEDAPWNTRTCMAMFDAWRGVVLIGRWKNGQASECAKGLAANYTREQVVLARTDMEADPYYIDKGGCDICDVANNIHKYLKRREKQHLKLVAASQPAKPTQRILTKDELRRIPV